MRFLCLYISQLTQIKPKMLVRLQYGNLVVNSNLETGEIAETKKTFLSINIGLFRTKSNIYDGLFCENG